MLDENTTQTVTKNEQARGKPKSRVILLVTLLNLLLMGGLFYKTFGNQFLLEPGINIVLVNDTPSAIVDLTFDYPGGKLNLSRIGPTEGVGNPIPVSGAFDATISFKDETGVAFREPVKIKPVGELALSLHIQPILEKLDVATQDGKVLNVLKASTSHVRVLPCFQGTNTTNLW